MSQYPPPLKRSPAYGLDSQTKNSSPDVLQTWVVAGVILLVLFLLLLWWMLSVQIENARTARAAAAEPQVAATEPGSPASDSQDGKGRSDEDAELGADPDADAVVAASAEKATDAATADDVAVDETVSDESTENDSTESELLTPEQEFASAGNGTAVDDDNRELTDDELAEFTASGSAGNAGAAGIAPLSGKVKFFGIDVEASYVVFVIDCSSSMSGGKLTLAKAELHKSLDKLHPNQRVSVYFYNDVAYFEPQFIGCRASKSNIKKIQAWIQHVGASCGTQPETALNLAVKEKCDAIFLLSDGEIPQDGAQIAKLNPRRKPIHTVAMETDSHSLQDVAAKNGGTYRCAR